MAVWHKKQALCRWRKLAERENVWPILPPEPSGEQNQSLQQGERAGNSFAGRGSCHLPEDGNAYMKNGHSEHEMYKNGPKMSVLYIRRMIFSMYGGGQMLYNIDSHMDKSVIADRR